MIDKGSLVILRTKDAIYSPCKIVNMSKQDVAVTFFKGMRWDKEKERYVEDRVIEVIPRKNIIRISERT